MRYFSYICVKCRVSNNSRTPFPSILFANSKFNQSDFELYLAIRDAFSSLFLPHSFSASLSLSLSWLVIALSPPLSLSHSVSLLATSPPFSLSVFLPLFLSTSFRISSSSTLHSISWPFQNSNNFHWNVSKWFIYCHMKFNYVDWI